MLNHGRKHRNCTNLGDYIENAWKNADPDATRDVLEASVLWNFVRELKTDPTFAELDTVQAIAAIDAWLVSRNTAWAELLLCRSDEDARARFADVSEKVAFAAGYSPLEDAIRTAKAFPVKLLQPPRTSGYLQFLSVCFWLQGELGDGDVFLPCRRVAQALEVDKGTVSLYRKWAVKDGLLRIVHLHELSTRRATRFRFATTRFDENGKQKS